MSPRIEFPHLCGNAPHVRGVLGVVGEPPRILRAAAREVLGVQPQHRFTNHLTAASAARGQLA